jgi:hypothetical protein
MEDTEVMEDTEGTEDTEEGSAHELLDGRPGHPPL